MILVEEVYDDRYVSSIYLQKVRHRCTQGEQKLQGIGCWLLQVSQAQGWGMRGQSE